VGLRRRSKSEGGGGDPVGTIRRFEIDDAAVPSLEPACGLQAEPQPAALSTENGGLRAGSVIYDYSRRMAGRLSNYVHWRLNSP
jgi:hypothetical protein